MGQIVRRKRRGRPSNTDRARINSSAAPPSPVDRRRSHRRRNVRYNFDIDDYVDDDEFYDDEDEEVGRREKKLRLLLYEDDSRSNRRVRHAPASSSSDEYDEDEDVKYSKKRKIDGGDGEDDEDNEIEEIRERRSEEPEDDEEDEEDAPGGSDFDCGTTSDLPKGGVPLPDKKTLEFILDKLQKKDTYGVYAVPVDPDELPDYHDVIKHPMDFATIRKKLTKGAYSTLKEFESDVFLICSNAMQYNAPDTVYYKQASSIQEQAKLRFQRLKVNVDRSEIELNTDHKPTSTFSPPKKQLKKPVGRPVHDPVDSETNGSSAQTPVRQNSSEVLFTENSCLPDNSLDKDQELLPGKSYVSKLGRKVVYDENRRATYNTSIEPVTESESVFSIFEGESKQFIPVGLHVDHSYARSLARFAATLGSVAWKVASKTIEHALPAGVKYGRGWVGEYEPLPTQVLIMPGNYTRHFERKKRKPTLLNSPRVLSTQHSSYKHEPVQDPRKPPFNHPSSQNDGFAPGRTVAQNQTLIGHDHQQQQPPHVSDPVQMMKMLPERTQSQSQSQSQQNNSNSFNLGPKRDDPQILSRRDDSSNVSWMSLGGTPNTNPHKQQQIIPDTLYNNNRQQQQQQQQQLQASRFRGEVQFQQPVQGHMMQNRNVGFPQSMTADLSRFQVGPTWRGVSVTPQMQMLRPKQQESRPPDLNIGYQSSPVRQSTGMLVDSQQPDLALQL